MSENSLPDNLKRCPTCKSANYTLLLDTFVMELIKKIRPSFLGNRTYNMLYTRGKILQINTNNPHKTLNYKKRPTPFNCSCLGGDWELCGSYSGGKMKLAGFIADSLIRYKYFRGNVSPNLITLRTNPVLYTSTKDNNL